MLLLQTKKSHALNLDPNEKCRSVRAAQNKIGTFVARFPSGRDHLKVSERFRQRALRIFNDNVSAGQRRGTRIGQTTRQQIMHRSGILLRMLQKFVSTRCHQAFFDKVFQLLPAQAKASAELFKRTLTAGTTSVLDSANQGKGDARFPSQFANTHITAHRSDFLPKFFCAQFTNHVSFL